MYMHLCRADALVILNMVMAAAPQHVTGTYLLPALQHYTHLLAPSQRARSVSAGSMKNLLQVHAPLFATISSPEGACKIEAPQLQNRWCHTALIIPAWLPIGPACQAVLRGFGALHR